MARLLKNGSSIKRFLANLQKNKPFPWAELSYEGRLAEMFFSCLARAVITNQNTCKSRSYWLSFFGNL
jgi:hypothetical protein